MGATEKDRMPIHADEFVVEDCARSPDRHARLRCSTASAGRLAEAAAESGRLALQNGYLAPIRIVLLGAHDSAKRSGVGVVRIDVPRLQESRGWGRFRLVPEQELGDVEADAA